MTNETIIAAIKSLIDIDTFFEEFDNVRFWKQQLADAEIEMGLPLSHYGD